MRDVKILVSVLAVSMQNVTSYHIRHNVTALKVILVIHLMVVLE